MYVERRQEDGVKFRPNFCTFWTLKPKFANPFYNQTNIDASNTVLEIIISNSDTTILWLTAKSNCQTLKRGIILTKNIQAEIELLNCKVSSRKQTMIVKILGTCNDAFELYPCPKGKCAAIYFKNAPLRCNVHKKVSLLNQI